MKQNRKGFTLAELLIVVAIIGVLVAIAIPIFTAQLERSRESTDLANARGMYAEVMAAAIGEDSAAAYNGAPIKQGDGTYKAVYSPLKQMQNGWQTNMTDISIGGVPSSAWKGTPAVNGSCTITYNPTTNTVTISWDGSSGSGSGDDPGDNPGDNPTGGATANESTLTSIGNNIYEDVMSGAHQSTSISVTITPGSAISAADITISKHTGTVTPEQVLNALKAELEKQGLMKDGVVVSNPEDTVQYFTMEFGNNNGHNRVKVTAHY